MNQTDQPSSGAKPTIGAAIASPMALANLFASLATLVCLVFPHSIGLDQSAHAPLSPQRFEEGKWIFTTLCLWPFAFAACTLLLTLVLTVVRPASVDRVLIIQPIVLAALMSFGWLMVLFSDIDGSRAAMAIGAIVIPLGTMIGLRMLWLYQRDQIVTAAIWGQGFLCVLAVFSLRWFWWPSVETMLPGGWLAIASAIAMLLASWTWRRARHDLLDRDAPVMPFQMSLSQIGLAVALTAIALTYWRILGI